MTQVDAHCEFFETAAALVDPAGRSAA